MARPSVERRRVVGILLGTGFPRGGAGEIVVRVHESIALGAGFSYLPQMGFPGYDSDIEMYTLETNVRWLLGGRSFYLGFGTGYQSHTVTRTDTTFGKPLVATSNVGVLFLAPQIGWMIVFGSGFSLQIGAGLELPLGTKEPSADMRYGGVSVPSDPPPGAFPVGLPDRAKAMHRDSSALSRLFTDRPFPRIDLLKVGFFF